VSRSRCRQGELLVEPLFSRLGEGGWPEEAAVVGRVGELLGLWVAGDTADTEEACAARAALRAEAAAARDAVAGALVARWRVRIALDESNSDTTLYSSFVILYTKYTG
jgi:hypothetical protein